MTCQIGPKCLRDESITHKYTTPAHTCKGATDTRRMRMDVGHSLLRTYGCSMAARLLILGRQVLLHGYCRGVSKHNR